ncbi:MAG: PAS domain S-box protein [Anaerolineae bacterium]|nr:PAS domain S-box protein [Anaerolineae bacterium]
MLDRLSSAARLWQRWIEPIPAVVDDEARRQARLLASLLLASIILVLVMLPIPMWINQRPFWQNPESITGLIGVIVCFIGYRLSREGRRYPAVGLSIVYGTAAILVPALTHGGAEGLHALYFLVVLVIFGNLFLPFRLLLATFFLQVLMVLIALNWMPHITFHEALRPLNFNVFTGLIVVLVMLHRSRLEHERAQKLAESEQRYKDLIRTQRDIIYEQSATGEMLSINEAVQPILGYTPAEAVGMNVKDLLHPDDFPDALQFLERMKRHEPPTPINYRLLTKSGEPRWIETHMTPHYQNGKLIRMAGITRDITERKQAEEALKQSEERYRIISELISDYAFSYEVLPDGSLVDEWMTSAPLIRVTGYTYEEVKDTMKPLHPDEMERVKELQQRTLQGEETDSEHRIITKSGEMRWVRVFRTPIWDEREGRVVRYYGVAQDITERKLAEEALKHSEERYRIILELISDYAFSYEVLPDGSLIEEWITRASFQRVTGYEWEEINLSQSLLPIHPDDQHLVTDLMKHTLHGEATDSEHRIITKSGEVRWIHMYRKPIWSEDEKRVVRYYGVAQDITERKRAEEALKQSEERYRQISELISDYAYYYRIDPDGRRVREWITGSFTRLTGYHPDEISGENIAILIAPEYIEQLQEDRHRVAQGESVSREYRMITKEGEPRWLHIYRVPVQDENETRVIGYFGVAQDVTERKQAEAQKLKLALEQDRSRLVGQFVLAISHDFRTSLATIETSRYLVERTLQKVGENPVQAKLDTIERAVMHMGKQLENLHMVSSLTNSRPTRRNLNQLVDAVVNEQRERAQHKELSLIFTPMVETLWVIIDEEKVKLAVQHLLINAMSHTPPGGQITLRTYNSPQGILLEVQDSGNGIEPRDLPHIFDLFYRGDASRNQEWGGVGLGLTIVKMIVEAHDGTLSVNSSPGEGSTFTIILPGEWDVVGASD